MILVGRNGQERFFYVININTVACYGNTSMWLYLLNTAKPTERQNRLTILADSLAKQSMSQQCKLLWKSV